MNMKVLFYNSAVFVQLWCFIFCLENFLSRSKADILYVTLDLINIQGASESY